MKRKSLISFLIVFCLVMMFSTSVSANDGSDVCPEGDGIHTWKYSKTIKDRTCTEDGIREYKCSKCNATKEEPYASIGHSWRRDSAGSRDATCTEAGEDKYVCYYCSEVKYEPVPAKGHSLQYDGRIKEATCTEKGKEKYICRICDTVVYKDIAATGHSYYEYLYDTIKEATCTENGLKALTCMYCNNVKYESIPATGHKALHLSRIEPSYYSEGHESGDYCIWCDKYVSGGAPISKTTHKDEWYGGKWYNKSGKVSSKSYYNWHKDSTGWWFTNENNKYAYGGWLKIEGDWYYFKNDGYMAQNEWLDGYWFGNSGAWTYKPTLSWHRDSYGWWVQDTSGWYPRNQWQKIDGYWYYFNSLGYMAVNQYVDGYWLGIDGTYY